MIQRSGTSVLLIRLFVQRKGSSKRQFQQRIPADVRKGRGQELQILVGDEPVALAITLSMASIRLSLRTGEAGEAKVRQAQIAGQLETVWQALRGEESPSS